MKTKRNNTARDNRTTTTARADGAATAAAATTAAPAARSDRRDSRRRATKTARPRAAAVTVRVRETGESITRVPVQRSGYQVVRYDGFYRTVRGGGKTPLYISFDDTNGRT
jgi:hypothetical protein